jgi:hypothetical protein
MKIVTLFILLLLLASYKVTAEETAGSCLSNQELELLNLVNDYRNTNNKASVNFSRVLNTVGQWHAEDAFLNSGTLFTPSCNLHSWSNDMPHLWTPVCYTSDHAQASKMWNKPREISGGSYTGNGYENAAWGYVSPAAALNGWKNSPGHNDVILNQGIWASLTWRAMGVGIRGSYYYLWFSDTADNSTPLSACDDVIFKHGFE